MILRTRTIPPIVLEGALGFANIFAISVGLGWVGCRATTPTVEANEAITADVGIAEPPEVRRQVGTEPLPPDRLALDATQDLSSGEVPRVSGPAKEPTTGLLCCTPSACVVPTTYADCSHHSRIWCSYTTERHALGIDVATCKKDDSP